MGWWQNGFREMVISRDRSQGSTPAPGGRGSCSRDVGLGSALSCQPPAPLLAHVVGNCLLFNVFCFLKIQTQPLVKPRQESFLSL